MTVARSVADVLDDHVVFEVESIDRMYLNVWQPRLAYGGGVQGFFVGHRGYHYASTALMDPMTKAFVADIHGFVAARGLELVSFAKGQRKDDLAQQFLARFTDEEGVLFVGRAQEKAGVWRTQRRYSPSSGGSYAWLVRSTAFINFFYFYCVDADFGPFFLKFSTYFPYTAKLCINGNEWAKRQAAKAGIRFKPLDNGFTAVDDVPAVQAICDSLGPEHIDALLRKWLAILPHPFAPEDETAGYRYELSILQAEFSLTQMLDRPVAGRIFFEQVLHDNLDIGRPDQISLIFNRRIIRTGRYKTPGRFRTRVITNGVIPSLHIDYKNTKIKQYHKEGRALRTGRVAATHCCTAAPSGPCMRVPAHTAQAGPSGCSGRPLLFHGASCCPGGASGPDTGRVYEVCSSVARRAGRAVVGQVVHFDRLLCDPLEPPFPALGGLGWLVEVQEVVPAQGAPSRLPGEQADGVGVQRGFDLPSALGPVLGQVGIIWRCPSLDQGVPLDLGPGRFR